MSKILEKEIYVQYAQIALFDVEDRSSYPQWETGEESFVLGEKGIVVATQNDTRVKAIIYCGKEKANGCCIGSGTIQVGNQGLYIGNVVTNDLQEVEWPMGKAKIEIYVNQLAKANIIEFIIYQI